MNDRDEVEDIIIEMSQKVASLVADEINTEKFLEKNPNVCLVLPEGWTAPSLIKKKAVSIFSDLFFGTTSALGPLHKSLIFSLERDFKISNVTSQSIFQNMPPKESPTSLSLRHYGDEASQNYFEEADKSRFRANWGVSFEKIKEELNVARIAYNVLPTGKDQKEKERMMYVQKIVDAMTKVETEQSFVYIPFDDILKLLEKELKNVVGIVKETHACMGGVSPPEDIPVIKTPRPMSGQSVLDIRSGGPSDYSRHTSAP